MRFESIPVPKQALRVRSPEWEPTQWRKDPFAAWGDEVPVQSVKTDLSHLGSFMIVAANRAFPVVADSPAAARILSDALSSAGATLARLRDRDARGGWNLEVAFFARRPLEFGDIQIEVDESSRRLFKREMDYAYKPVKKNGDKPPGTSDSNSIVDSWFFIKPFYSWCEDDELKSVAPRKRMDSFCVIGESNRFVVQKVSRKLPNCAEKGDVFLASNATRYHSAHDGDRTILLALGNLSFCSRAEAVRLRAEAQMQALVKNDDSYLRNWEQYNEEEGNIRLARARDFGAVRYGKVHPSVEDGNDVSILTLQDVIESVRDKLSDCNNSGLELQLLQQLPEWIANPELTIRQLLDQIASQRQNEVEEQSAQGLDVGEWRFDRDSNELKLSRPISAIPRSGYVVVSLNGFMRAIRRRDEARRRIMACASANPNLGTILEAHGIPEPLEKRRRVAPESVHSKHLFRHGATDRQIDAIDIALNTPDIALIQGPPGTGKTTVITAVLNRLNELSPRTTTGKASVLLCGFQHDAVENMIERVRINSLPVPKFGRKRNGSGRDSEFRETDSERERRQWCENVARAIREKNPQLAETEETHRIRDLVIQYVRAPDIALARSICQAIINLPTGSISVECRERARQAVPKIESYGRVLKTTALDSALGAVRALRVSARAFCDDGPERAADLLDECGQDFDEEEKIILRRAVDWLDGDPLDFLPQLREIKRSQLVRLTMPPVFIVEKHLDFMLSLARDALASISENMMTGKDRRTAALLEFVEALEGDPEGMLDAISEYSYAIAATCQQCANWKVAEVKGVRRKKNDTREVPPMVYDYVIVDEAARAQPLDLLIPMSQGKRILLVGDHRQLPQMVDDELAAKLERGASQDEISGLEDEKWWKESLFEYLFTKRIPELEKRDGITRRVTLDTQFRMHRILGQFISDNFYKRFSDGEAFFSRLGDDCYAHSLPVPGNGPILWIDVPNVRGGISKCGGSCVRDSECDIIANRLEEWMKSKAGKELSFGIISFYRGQVARLKGRLNNRVDGKRLHIGTVDSFQGKEFDVVFLSLVRTSEFLDSRHPYGFLTVYNRLNVAMSRQKRLLVAVGDADFFGGEMAKKQVSGLYAFLKLCQSMNAVEECA